MFDRFESLVFQLIICFTLLAMNSCLNITEMTVPSIVMAPDKALLTCVKQEDTQNDTFVYLHWYKFIDNDWKLVKSFPPISGNLT